MSLSRQLLLLIATLYLLVFAGNFYLTVDNTRRYAATQLESHAEDTATSLGLSLSNHLADGDILLMESMVDAIFDRGYFRQIHVLDTEGKSLIARDVPITVSGVPPWFIDWLELETPLAQATLMTGWTEGGVVQVMSHPGFAYEELWGSAVETLWWSLLTLIIAFVATYFGIRVALRPLVDVEAQALAVAQRDFTLVERIPKARELRRVVEAMNAMTVKVAEMVTEQHDRSERQRQDAFIDKVTQLGNRAAFEREVERMAASTDESMFGSVVLCQLAGLDELNRTAGYERGDAMLRLAASTLDQLVTAEHGFATRLGGGLFGLVFSGVPRSEQDRLLETVHDGVSNAMSGEGYSSRIETGAAYFGGSQDAAILMQRAQAALHAASLGTDTRAIQLHDATEVVGGHDTTQELSWRTILGDVMQAKAVVPHYQCAVRVTDGEVLHYEVLARLNTGGERLVEPGLFMPMAVRLGLAVDMDRSIVEAVMQQTGTAVGHTLSINLTRQSVLDPAFHQWLADILKDSPVSSRLAFEVAEPIMDSEPDAVLGLAAVVHAHGGQVGLDRCGASGIALDRLRTHKAHYHKIDGQFIRDVHASPERQRYLEAMLQLRHGLDIIVIAERVESAPELDSLRALGVDGAQGFFIGEPGEKPW